ncbi:MAG: DNA repair protein RadC [bacterium]|nr:DNA repair protein RadC [bacterium]
MLCHDCRRSAVQQPTLGTETSPPRLWPFAAQTQCDAELLAVLLRGRPETSALEMAREIIAEGSGQAGLSLAVLTQPTERLLQRPWFTQAWLRLHAAVELGRRVAWSNLANGVLLNRSQLAVEYLMRRYGGSEQEVVGALWLNADNRLIGAEEIFRGTASRAAVEPRQILRLALQHNASGLIVFHNHPSGDPRPSVEDLCFTRHLGKQGSVLGLRLVDHLIVGRGRWVSIQTEEGAGDGNS